MAITLVRVAAMSTSKNSKRPRENPTDLSLSPKSVSLLFYTISEDEFKKDPKHGTGCQWVCYCGASRTKTGNGYSNLFSHVRDSHPHYEMIFGEVLKAGWKGERNSSKQYLDAIAAKEEESERMGLKSRGPTNKPRSTFLCRKKQ